MAADDVRKKKRTIPKAGTVEPRKRPRQERSQEMVERILEATKSVIRDDGLMGLSTISIARRAELSVGSLYQYFPNKESIILDLARRWLAAFRDVHERMEKDPRPTNWGAFQREFCQFNQTIAAIYVEHGDLLPVLAGMQSNAELRRLDHDHDLMIVEFHARWYRSVNPSLDDTTAKRLGRMILETGHPSLSHAASKDVKTCKLIVKDLETMHLALLKPYLAPKLERVDAEDTKRK